MHLHRPRALALTGLLLAALAAPLLPAAAAAPTAAAPRATALNAAAPHVATPHAAAPAFAGAAASLAAGQDLGYDRIGVRRADTWYLRDALDGGPNRNYVEQTAGYLPVAGDTDGDGNGTVSLFKDGLWLISDRERSAPRVFRFGIPGDLPVLGDWDGDGVDTIGVFRGGRWYLRNVNASGPSVPFGYGIPGDKPVVGDWDGNGRTDIGVTRGNRWYQRDSASSGPSSRTFLYGISGDLPVAGDWDHDGKDTPGVFRGGFWYLRQGSFPSPYQVVRFGLPGDRPVVRRTQGLAPGVRHGVVKEASGPFTTHVLSVDLAQASSPDAVLSDNQLRGIEPVSTMARRAGAVAGVNGDYFLGSGRPVHLYAEDGRLIQTPTTLGRAFSLDASGTKFSMGYPDVRSTFRAQPLPEAATATAALEVPKVNLGAPGGADGAAYTGEGALLETPPDQYCYATLVNDGLRRMGADGSVQTPMTVNGPTRCGGNRAMVPGNATVLSADPTREGGTFIRALGRGSQVSVSQQLGFPGAVDAVGGNPLLVIDGRVATEQVTGSGAFFGRNPRTAVGVTRQGTLLLVVVDGRSSAYSRGMSLRELAELMQALGAVDAMNLDGGGSSTMFLNGLVANRPSDVVERSVANAVVVLPGADPGQSDLTSGVPLGTAAARRPTSVESAPTAEQTDPGSTGGLADALVRKGIPVSGALRRTAEVFRENR